MSKKLKVILSVVVAVVLLTTGSAVAVMADEEPAPMGEAGASGLLARVAEILDEDISEQDLIDAFKQAVRETAGEAVDRILDRLQEEGVLLEDEIAVIEDWLAQKPETLDRESIEEWLEQRPEISKPGLFKCAMGAAQRIRAHLKHIGGQCLPLRPLIGRVAEILDIPEETLIEAFKQAQQEIAWERREEALAGALERAVENGRITQPEADDIEVWWGQRPAAFDCLGLGAVVSQAARGRQMMALRKGLHSMRQHRWAD